MIAQTCERVAVMYAGQIVETGTTRDLIHQPRHPYTVGLLGSVPSIDSDERYLNPIAGSPPSLVDPPVGCRFYDRCPVRMDACRTWHTELLPAGPSQAARCIRYLDVETAHD